MDQKAALLSQLRIDRSEAAEDPEAGRRRRWMIGIGALIVLLIVIASGWYLSVASRVSVHVAVAQACIFQDMPEQNVEVELWRNGQRGAVRDQ